MESHNVWFALGLTLLGLSIAVSVPLHYATGSKPRALGPSFLSGLAEPLGALIGCFLLLRCRSDFLFGLLLAGVAGTIIFISLDELLPTAEKYGEPHLAILGLIASMAVMALSLLLFA